VTLHGPSILIADDTLTAQCLQRLIDSEFPFVEIVTDAQELVNLVAESKPQLILLDITLPSLSGLGVLSRLRSMSPDTKVIIVTVQEEPEFVAECLRAGAAGYVLKRCAVSELVSAIRLVLSGQSFLTRSLPRLSAAASKGKFRTNAKSLTLRQREVLQLVAQGRTAKEIANALGVSVKTAVFHKMAIMDKLALRTTADLTRYAIEHGLLSSLQKAEPSLANAGMRLAASNTSA
jgi:DNA-binding NarL/FixJ family response regulator